MWLATAVFVLAPSFAFGSGARSVAASTGPLIPQGELTPEQFLVEHDQRLASHAYFSKVLMLRGAPSQAPIALYVQKPQVETPNWQAELTAAHLPWFEALEREFRNTLATPLDLKRRGDIPLNVVCVLQTQGDYVNYAGALQNTMWVSAWGAFERRSRWTVTFHSGGKSPLVERRRGILHEFTQALLHAHLGAGVGELRAPWVATGLGAYFTSAIGAVPTTLASRAPSARALAEVASTVADASARHVYLAPIAELVRASEAQQLVQSAAARAQALNGKVSTERMLQRLGAQCELWMHFLLDAGGPQRRADIHEYLGLVLSGRAVDGAFEKAFAPQTPEQLQREFFRWVLGEHAKLDPKSAVDLALVETLFRPAPPAGASAKPAAAGATPTPGANAPAAAAQPNSLASVYQRLAPAPDDHLAAHGRVLQRIAHGELALARTELDALLARAKGADIERRLERERERLAALTALRDAHFNALVTSGAKKSWSFGQRKFAARVVKYENETLHFEENKLGFGTLEARHVPHSVWLKELPKELASGEHGWARHYAALLEGAEGALKRLDKNDPRCDDLRADFESWCPGVLRLGEAVKRLDEIVATGLAAEAGDAAGQVEALSALRRDFGALEFVQSREALLREAATLLLERGYSLANLAAALPGKAALTADGSLRWTLGFDSQAELDMFEPRTDLFERYRASLAPLGEGTVNGTSVRDGVLRLGGSGCAILPLAFEVPVALRRRMRFEPNEVGGTQLAMFVVGYRNSGSYIAGDVMGNVTLFDSEKNVTLSDWPKDGASFDAEVWRETELSVSATHVRTSLGGVTRSELPSHAGGNGALLLVWHTPFAVELDRYEVEGKVEEASAKRLWVKLRLAAAGW
jgi:hypothetical protein